MMVGMMAQVKVAARLSSLSAGSAFALACVVVQAQRVPAAGTAVVVVAAAAASRVGRASAH